MTADLIVVDKLARLYDCPEDEMLCHVLAVVTLPAWKLAARNPNKVAPTSVIRHQPLAIHAFPDALCRPSTQQEARKTTPKHEFVCLHDVGRLREWLKQNSCTENIRGFQGLTRYKSGLE